MDEFNREMAAVFGLPFAPPEGTCLGPSADAPADAASSMWPPNSNMPPTAPFTYQAAAPPAQPQEAGQQQAVPAAAAELLQELRQHSQQLQRQIQQLQQLIQLDPISSSSMAADAATGSCAATADAMLMPCTTAVAAPARHEMHGIQQQPPGSSTSAQQLSHVDGTGRASMVDVAGKASSGRVAAASCRVLLGEAAFRAVAANAIAKGDVLRVAQIAGIQGAKATAQLIPLCHNIFISSVNVDLRLDEASHAVDITATARAAGQTGVEMEALTGAAVAALTVYDMTKAVSKGIEITQLQLEYKEGGKSGVWRRGS